MQSIIENVKMTVVFKHYEETSVFQGPQRHLVPLLVVALVPAHSPEVGLGR